MQKRVHRREWKRDMVRQVITGQKRPVQACRDSGLASVCFLAGGKRSKSEEKRHFNLRKQMDQQPRNSGSQRLSSAVDNSRSNIRFSKKRFSGGSPGAPRSASLGTSRASRPLDLLSLRAVGREQELGRRAGRADGSRFRGHRLT